ncbi:MAG: glycosyltransferase family 2 protein [Cypionkella sp.]
MRATAVLCVKNEGAFVLEWLAHHRTVGFSDFLVYSNDCSDGTDAMLDRLAAMGQIVHIRNNGPHDQGPQWAMLRAAQKHPALRAADWVAVLDIDEFVNIHAGARRLPDLLAALPNADAITLTWRLFGNGGQVALRDAPVLQTFTHAAPATLGWPWRAQMFKTLFRGPNAGPYEKLGVHRPRSPKAGATPRWYDGSGRVLPAAYHAGRVFSDYTQNNYALVQLNHYPLGSVENYLVKADRGRANRDASSFDMGYWTERNLNEVEDTSILALDSRAALAQLMEDAVLADLHRSAFAWRRARFAQLMQSEPWRALYGRLRMAPPSRSLSGAQAREITQHIPRV